MGTREDEWGVWKVEEGKNCNIETLIEPSDAFRQWQEEIPEPEPSRDLTTEIDDLKARVQQLENK